MSLLLTTAGMKFYIGAAMTPPNEDVALADFASVSWTEIKGTTNHGTMGDTSEVATSPQIGRARVRKAKTVRNAGTVQLVADLDSSDPGQIALIAAEKTKHAYPFKIEFDDAPPPNGTPSERYFIAFVMSASEAYESATDVVKLNATLEVDSNIVRVIAAEATP